MKQISERKITDVQNVEQKLFLLKAASEAKRVLTSPSPLRDNTAIEEMIEKAYFACGFAHVYL